MHCESLIIKAPISDKTSTLTSLMKSPISPGWGRLDLTGYWDSAIAGLSSTLRTPAGLLMM